MDCFAALADPTRRRIVETLAGGPLSSGEIAAHFTISAPAVSQHLKALRDARLVRVQVRAQRRIYELDADGFAELDRWLGAIRQSWRGPLVAQERRLIKRGDGKASPGDGNRA